MCLSYYETEMTTTTDHKTALLEMFTDRTAGESYAQGRLQTRESDSGTIELIAYGWLKIAEYNERRESVTVFTGHKANDSSILTRYINDVIDVANERRNVILSGESPYVGQPNDGTQFIGEYVDFSTKLSSVERKAVKFVEDSIEILV